LAEWDFRMGAASAIVLTLAGNSAWRVRLSVRLCLLLAVKAMLSSGIDSSSQLPHQLTGFCLAVDCLTLECRRDRIFAVTELAEFYGRQRNIARSCAGCAARTAAAGASPQLGW
jgi:hypothetical protein